MSNVNEIFREARLISSEIEQLLAKTEYVYDNEFQGIIYNENDAEELFVVDELRNYLSKLEEASRIISYLERPIKAEGTLHKGKNGRYSLHSENAQYDGYEFTSGTGIEYLAEDDWHAKYDEENDDYINIPYWKAGTVEHNGIDYYIVGSPTDLKMESLRVRIR